MSPLRKLRYLLPSRRQAEEQEMQQELQSLREMAGPSELGNLTLAAEDARTAFTWVWLEQLAQDLRYAARSMTTSKAFSAMAVLSLALAIGANTAIYSFIESILQRSLPVPDPQSLVMMKWRTKTGYPAVASTGFSLSGGGNDFEANGAMTGAVFPYPALKLFQDRGDILSSAFCYVAVQRLTVTSGDNTDSLDGVYVSGDYFRGMGVSPAAGRLIIASDDEIGAPSVAVVSDQFARQRFGDAGAAVGMEIRINNRATTVAGVAPRGFFGAEPGSTPDIFIPMQARIFLEPGAGPGTLSQLYLDTHYYWIEVMARLNRGVTLAQAQAVLSPQFDQFLRNSAAGERERADLPRLTIVPGGSGPDTLRRPYAKPIYVLMAMVGSILLIACANIANLLLARAAARRREIAIRLSIGATRLRVVRQLLTESVFLSFSGGLLGIGVAVWSIRVLTLLIANGREHFTLHAELNWHVLGMTFALSLLTGMLVGVAPAVQATRIDVTPALKAAESNMTPRRSGRAWRRVPLSKMLVVVQIALSLLLLVAAGLFGRTLSNLHSIKLGFNRENLLLFTITPGAVGYEGPALTLVYQNLQQRLSEIPAVRAVTLSSGALPAGGGTMASVQVEAARVPAQNAAGLFGVGAAFFTTMQIPLISGRDFSEQDATGGPPVAIVNQQFQKSYGLDGAVGRFITIRDSKYEIVGVVGDALFLTLKEDYRPMVYRPYMQNNQPPPEMTFEVQTSGNPLDQADAVRRSIRQFDSRIAISDMKTEAVHVDQAINREITLARLCTVFAALALVIACIGLYGMVAFNVAQRAREIGIRVALGATRGSIVWFALREILLLGFVGLMIGIPLVLAASRLVSSFLFGIEPNDPASIMLAVGILLAAGLLAGYLPARRASYIDPMTSIRFE